MTKYRLLNLGQCLAIALALGGCGIDASFEAIKVEKEFGSDSSCLLVYRELVMARNTEFFWESGNALSDCGEALGKKNPSHRSKRNDGRK